MQRKGTLVGDGEHAVLTFERTYRHAPERVWDAIATPEGLAGWLMCTKALIEPRVGGRIEMISGPSAYHSIGAILAWEPPHLLEYEWNVAPVSEMPHGERAIFRYELIADGEVTHLLVTYRRITRRTGSGFLPGLHAFLDRLEAQLAGAPLPEWLTRFAEIREQYPEWREHAASSAK
jgi:uncharacterized protein YndB with AHSA1/START domain